MTHRPRKRFGQHFLHDQRVIERIVDAIDPRPGQHVVEIGPGLGALTLPLLDRLGGLDAVELDRDLCARLRETCADSGRLNLHAADALQFDFCTLVRDEIPLRIVGNLPYNISTPLMFHLFTQWACIADLHVMLQSEVASRLTAAPGTKAYGRLTLMVAVTAEAERLFTISPRAFRPPPKVTSALVRLTPRPPPPIELEAFAAVVAQAFSMRRKTLRNALKRLLTVADIQAAGVDPAMRPEDVSPAGYVALTKQLLRRNA